MSTLLPGMLTVMMMAATSAADQQEVDCNLNGVADSTDIQQGTSQDCNNNGIPDECEATPCPPLEVVFVIDTSGSMVEEADLICAKVNGIIAELESRGVVVIPQILNISNQADNDGSETPETNFACLEGTVLDAFADTGPPLITTNEDWARGMKKVSRDKLNWTPGAVRLVIGISDEDPHGGRGCNDTDAVVVGRSIEVALDGNIHYSVIKASPEGAVPVGADLSCIDPLAQQMANDTGGSVHSTADSVESIADAYEALLDGLCDPSNDCNENGVPDDCEIDCNNNGVPDDCDIANGTSEDCNGNGIPDECEPDCNGNGVPDDCDIANGTSQDCNGNGIPDECDIGCQIFEPQPDAQSGHGDTILGLGQSQDCNQNGVPDECELENNDCNNNGIPDDCDINGGIVDCDVLVEPIDTDDNNNGIPDDCDNTEPGFDCNENGIADDLDIIRGDSDDVNQNGVPDECEIDCFDIPEVTCAPVEIVVVMDTSSSMHEEARQLCEGLNDSIDLLMSLGIDVRVTLLGITGDPDDFFPCLEGNVRARYGAGVPNLNGETIGQLNKNEDWADGIAVVAARHPWQEGVTRVIIPISDEDPQDGDGCDVDDGFAINNAILVANANNVIVSPILADSSNVAPGRDLSCLLPLASRTAIETGGILVEVSEGLADDVSDAIERIVLDLCSGDQDCNDNGILDQCDIRDGVSIDCNENGVPDECEIAANPELDLDDDGRIDGCVSGEPGGPCDLTGEREVDFTVQGTDGGMWTSQVVSGTGAFIPSPAAGNGLCMQVPETGENLIGWRSPRQWIELKDMTAYRVRVTMSTSQTDPDRIPMWTVDYDNSSTPDFQVNYGGFAWFVSVDGAANGIGTPAGRSVYDVWVMPNAVKTPQWRGLLADGTTGAFAPEADALNDMRVMVRTLDFDSNGIGSEIDAGTICIERIEVDSIPLECLEACDSEEPQPSGEIPVGCDVVYDAPVNSTNHRFVNLVGGGTSATFNDTQDLARIVLDTTNGRASVKPGGPATPESRYPVIWEADTLYGISLFVQAGEEAAADPIDMIQVLGDTQNSELGVVHWSVRGVDDGPGSMFRAASPRKASVAGGPQEYVGLFYSHNVTASPLATAARLRPSGDFFNTPDLYGTGSGGDPLEVVGMSVKRLQLPAP